MISYSVCLSLSNLSHKACYFHIYIYLTSREDFLQAGSGQSFMWEGTLHKRSKHPPAECPFPRCAVALCAAASYVAGPVLLNVPKSTTSEENKLVLKQCAEGGRRGDRDGEHM